MKRVKRVKEKDYKRKEYLAKKKEKKSTQDTFNCFFEHLRKLLIFFFILTRKPIQKTLEMEKTS